MGSRLVSLPLETLALAALVVLGGYVIFGLTGFGASPITVPVLAHFFPLPLVLAFTARMTTPARWLRNAFTLPAGVSGRSQ